MDPSALSTLQLQVAEHQRCIDNQQGVISEQRSVINDLCDAVRSLQERLAVLEVTKKVGYVAPQHAFVEPHTPSDVVIGHLQSPDDGPAPMRLNDDVIGVIVSFAADRAARCGYFGLVSKRWFDAVAVSPALWAPGGLLFNFPWRIGTRVPLILQRHQELDGDATLQFDATDPRVNKTPQDLVVAWLPQLQLIPRGFLAKRKHLVSLRLDGLPQLKDIGDGFLQGCLGLIDVDLSGLDSLEMIGNGFLSGCQSLRNVYFSVNSSVKKIGSDFLLTCSSLTKMELCMFAEVTSIGHRFLSGCDSLQT